MKKIAYLSIVLSLLITPLSAAETQDCSVLKKLSRAYMNCKQNNIKAALFKAGNSVKKNTTGKIKSDPVKKIFDSKKIASAAKERKEALSSKFNNIFSGSTKQYPKGTKK
jgi:hypothetical protein|tara:strand:+ start:74 stop:403 length:330 start_codon:yes stop_codon:yes gene_type:complete